MKLLQYLLVFVCLSFPFTCVLSDTATYDYEDLLLQELYSSTAGVNWRTHWVFNEDNDHCQFTGVACNDSTGMVNSIILQSTNLVGTLPDSIGNFSQLITLMLTNNQLSSSIPSSIGSLTSLMVLTLSHNQFSGPIPNSFSNLVNLEMLTLDTNNLTGTIPSFLDNFAYLQTFTAFNNMFCGSNPSVCSNNPSYFNCGGPNPNCFSNEETILRDLYWTTSGPSWINQMNWLSGDFCTWYGITCTTPSYDHVYQIQLQSNNLIGPIPYSLGNLTQLQTLYLFNNTLIGSIPDIFYNFWNLQSISFQTNFNLTGSLPPSLKNLTPLIGLILFKTPIVDTLDFLPNLPNLDYLDIASCNFHGVIPEEIGTLKFGVLDLASNKNLSGTLPSSLGNLTHMTILYLDGNRFSGTVPESFSNLVNLQNFAISNNNLTGTIPSFFNNFTQLVTFASSNNSFCGSNPPFCSNTSFNCGGPNPNCNSNEESALRDLYQATSGASWINSTNWLSGDFCTWYGITCVPRSYGNIVQINLTSNNLIGFLPNSIGSLTNLEFVNLSQNQLSDPLPTFLQTAPPFGLNLTQNAFCCPIVYSYLLNESAITCILCESITTSTGQITSTISGYSFSTTTSNTVDTTTTSSGTGQIKTSTSGTVTTFLPTTASNTQTTTTATTAKSQAVLTTSSGSLTTVSPTTTSNSNAVSSSSSTSSATTTLSPATTSNSNPNGATTGNQISSGSSTTQSSTTLSPTTTTAKNQAVLTTSSGSLTTVSPTTTSNLNTFSSSSSTANSIPLSSTTAGGVAFAQVTPSSTSYGTVVGATLGSVLGVLLLILLVLFLLRKNNSNVRKLTNVFENAKNDFLKPKIPHDVYIFNVKKGTIIGSGNFGQVFRGKWQGAHVCLKTVTQLDKLEELKAEAAIFQKFNHPNIVTFYGLYEDQVDHTLYIVSELMETTLHSLLQNPDFRANSDIRTLLQLARGIASGMVQLEEKGIVHCDLRAENVLVIKQGDSYVPKLNDFGLSKNLYGLKDIDDPVFPVKWSAPELLQGKQISSKCDVFSFGVLFWEILTYGDSPYQGMTNLQAYEYVKGSNRLTLPRTTPENIEQLVQRCWDSEPETRPDFSEIVTIIEFVLGTKKETPLVSYVQLSNEVLLSKSVYDTEIPSIQHGTEKIV